MRQVPASAVRGSLEPAAHFLLIGDGRLARHLAHYLKLENLSFTQWSRRTGTLSSLEEAASGATQVLVALSDSAIEPFLREHPFLLNRECVHFSGALVSPLAPSVHPLMTFGPDLYTLDDYRMIPFVIEEERPVVLPGFSNRIISLRAELKPLYHALCAASGNFTVMLWESVFARFASLGLPREILYPYLARTAANLISTDGGSVLTGPIKRGDFATIEKHLQALRGDPLANVYRAFMHLHESPTVSLGGQL